MLTEGRKASREVTIHRDRLEEYIKGGVSSETREADLWLLQARPRALKFTLELVGTDIPGPTITVKIFGKTDRMVECEFAVPRSLLKTDDAPSGFRAASVDTSPRAHEIAARRPAEFYRRPPSSARGYSAA